MKIKMRNERHENCIIRETRESLNWRQIELTPEIEIHALNSFLEKDKYFVLKLISWKLTN